jgi:hypothetical protein
MKKLSVVAVIACAGFAGWIGGASSGCSPAEASTCDCPEVKPPEVIEAECAYEMGIAGKVVKRSFADRSAADLARVTAIGSFVNEDGTSQTEMGVKFHPLTVYVDDGVIVVPCESTTTTHVTLIVPPSLR